MKNTVLQVLIVVGLAFLALRSTCDSADKGRQLRDAMKMLTEIGPVVADLRGLSKESLDLMMNRKLGPLQDLQSVQAGKLSFLQNLLTSRTESKPEVIVKVETTFVTQLESLYVPYSISYDPRTGNYKWSAVKASDLTLGSGSGRKSWYRPVKFSAGRDELHVDVPRFMLHWSAFPRVTFDPVKGLGADLTAGLYYDRLGLTGSAAYPDADIKVGIGYLWLR